MQDLYHNLGVVQLLKTSTVTGSTNSNLLDLKGFEGAMLIVTYGAGTFSSASIVASLEESDSTSSSSFTEVDNAKVLGSFSAVDSTSNDECTQVVGYIGDKRYVRVKLTVSGTSISIPVTVLGVVGAARDNPVTAPSPVTAT